MTCPIWGRLGLARHVWLELALCTATREMAQRRFISDEHKSKELGTGPTPGPGRYKTFVTTGIQPESKTKTEPNYSFGTAIRFDKVADKRSAAVPGPGAYLV